MNTTTGTGSGSVVRWWLVASIGLCLGASIAAQPSVVWKEDFEDAGWSNRWAADMGTWDVGAPGACQPAFGPGGGFESAQCAATVVCANYEDWVETRFSQLNAFVVPPAAESPRLRFQHWFRFAAADYGEVYLRDQAGDLHLISRRYVNWSTDWSKPSLDISEYGGQSVRVVFLFHSEDQFRNGWDVSVGWYIDDVEVVTGEEVFDNPESFENGLGDWSVSQGIWEVGEPTSGPGAARTGDFLAATNLSGNYEDWQSSSLVSAPITIPEASSKPRLRFEHWFRFAAADHGEVFVFDPADKDDPWTSISRRYVNWSTDWSKPSLDLSAFAGRTVRIAFHFYSEDQFRNGWDVSVGWYIDDVEVVTGEEVFDNPESFENGLGDWSVSQGIWEVGEPTSGPGAARTGDFLAATNLSGNYEDWQSSSLVSAPITIPEASSKPRLRFEHWFRFAAADHGEVFVFDPADKDDPWTSISRRYVNWSTDWSKPSLDLSAFAGRTVRIAFHFYSEDQFRNGWDVSVGWYIDDVEVVTGEEVFDNPESFENGLGDWSVSQGIWEVGEPTSGPGAARTGDFLAATNLSGNYEDWQSSSLVSAPITIPEASSKPRLRFEHWFRFAAADHGEVFVFDPADKDDPWTSISRRYVNWSTDWSKPSLDLSAFAGRTVRIAFHFYSEDQFRNGWDVSVGWYIDDVEVVTGEEVFDNPESFENGLGDWSVSQGIWEVGEPTSGPGAARTGDFLAATNLSGNYEDWQSSSLVSAPITIPAVASPLLRFSHWHRFSAADYGEVYVVDGDEWILASLRYVGSSGDWTRPALDLAPYAGKTIRIAFFFRSEDQFNNGWDVSAGWYIDDVTIEPLPASPPFRRGDANGDATMNVADPVFTLRWLFRGGVTMPCQKAADVDDTGSINITDAVFSLRFLFSGGNEPAAPFAECGDDPTDDALTCTRSAPCSPGV